MRFFTHFDRRSGVPVLPTMVHEGSVVPGPSPLSRRLKAKAAAFLKAGPPRLAKADLNHRRYVISDLLEDLRAPRNASELRAAGIRLYELLADYHFRTNGKWSGRGKSIPRTFLRCDPPMGRKFDRAFDALFARGKAEAVIRLAGEILRKDGGPLFDGYRVMAPKKVG